MTKAAELAKIGEVATNSQIGGRRNIIINGAMQVAQRGTTTGQGNASAYSAVDRMNIHGGSTAGRLTSSQDSDSPVFFGNSLKLDCTTADTSIAAGEFLLLEQKLEGQDLQQLEFNQSSAKATTISFYVKGNAAAQYTFALQYHLASGTARWFTKGFAVTTDWARITITIPGDTQASDGSNYGIADDNATGANLMIWLHGGTNFSSGTHQDTAWADRDYTTLFQDNQTSFYDSTDRTFFFTGFQFELGSQATPFEHRSFGEELQLCKRYCQQLVTFQSTYESVGGAAGWGFSSTGVLQYIPLDVQMRIEPAISHNDLDVSDDVNSAIATTAIAVNANVSSPRVLYINCTVSSGITQYRSYHLRTNDTSDGKLICDAEL